MQKYVNAVADLTGAPVANASVQVNTYPASVAATIYSDNGVTPAANPLTTDTTGAFAFYAADGRYQLVISGSNIQTATLNDILLVDALPADLSTTLPSSSGKLWNNGGVISVS
jgi:hypothetical protein